MTAAELAPLILDGCRDPDRVEQRIDPSVSDATLLAPRHLLAQSLRGLVNNAIDASADDSNVEMEMRRDGSRFVFEVPRRRAWHGPERPRPRRRAVLHDEGSRQRHGARALFGPHRRRAAGRHAGLSPRPQGGTLARVELPVSVA